MRAKRNGQTREMLNAIKVKGLLDELVLQSSVAGSLGSKVRKAIADEKWITPDGMEVIDFNMYTAIHCACSALALRDRILEIVLRPLTGGDVAYVD